jgi:hypothetical protein
MNMSSATISSGDSIQFNALTSGKTCKESSLEWTVSSHTNSDINQTGFYVAGQNNSKDKAIDIIMINDIKNKLQATAIITILPCKNIKTANQDSELSGKPEDLAGQKPVPDTVFYATVIFLLSVLTGILYLYYKKR